MKKTNLGVLAVVFVLIISLGSIAQAEEKVIKIGGAVPLSGPVAYWGISTMQGWVDGAAVINEKGVAPLRGLHRGNEFSN